MKKIDHGEKKSHQKKNGNIKTVNNKGTRTDRPRTVSHGSYILTFVLFIISLLIYDMIQTPADTLDVLAVKNDLLNNVHNQTEAVQVLLDSLNNVQNHEQNVHIVNFIGPTGVGKTFIGNILKRHFHSVYEFNGPLDKNVHQNVLNKIKYTTSTYNLLVIDDLTVSDVDKLVEFLKEIPQDLMFFVICIFNIQETDNELNHTINYDNADKIIQKFNEAEILYKVATFHEFNKSQVKEWVIKQLQTKGINPELHSHIVESVLDNQNVKYHGLKGLSSKINLEL